MLRCRMCDHDHAPGSPQCPHARVGTTIAGKYKLVRLLGAGGMGAVYEAENVALGKAVAVKMLHARLAAQADLVARFRREARAVANLHHAGFPDIHALETTPDGELVIEMELLAGTPLDQLVGAPVPRVIALLAAALDALAVAHDAGLVHRDLKPENLMSVDERVVILDFGIARSNEEQKLTTSGQVFGTISYASPEQLKDTSRADARADVYSMGATAFELLAGQPPAGRGGMTEVMARILAGDIERHPAKLRPEVPAWLDAWVARALDADPAKRFANAREMAKSLRAAGEAGTEATLAPAATVAPAASTPIAAAPPVSAAPGPRRVPPLWIGLIAIAVVAAAIVAIVRFSGSSTSTSTSTKPAIDAGAKTIDAMTVDAAVAITKVAPADLITVDLTVWRGDAALAPGATLHVGDKVAFQVATNHPAYVYIVQRIQDDLDVLFPNKGIPVGNPVKTPLRIPKSGAFTLVDDGIYGTVRIVVIASPVHLADLDSVLATTAAQQGAVRETVTKAKQAIDSLGDAGAPAGSRGHLELLDDTQKRTISVRYTQRPDDPLVVATFDFEQAK